MEIFHYNCIIKTNLIFIFLLLTWTSMTVIIISFYRIFVPMISLLTAIQQIMDSDSNHLTNWVKIDTPDILNNKILLHFVMKIYRYNNFYFILSIFN